MDSEERLKYQVTFGFLAPSIEGQRKMDATYRAYVGTATELLEGIAEKLEFIVPPALEVPAVVQERIFQAKEGNLTDILRLHGYNPFSLTRGQVKNLAKYFRDRIEIFRRLIEDPEAVYGKFPDRARLLNLCEDFRKFYADNHQVLGEAKEPVEGEYFLPVHGKDETTD